MKRKNILQIILVTYVIFSTLCLIICLILKAYSPVVFKFWLFLTHLFRFGISVAMVVLIYRLIHLNKLKQKLKHWKE